MAADPALPTSEPPVEEFGLAKGATVGRYVVLGLLGRGGMGEVYAAYDPDLDRKIALKLLRARGGSNDTEGRTRLLREAQAIARLSHPNVVVVFDVGTFRDTVFVAMEVIEGHTLGYWIQAQTRTWREVLDVYSAAGRGLVAAHSAGLVHRDFKPDNVMITKSGQVRVMDFGLAREQGAPGDVSPVDQPPSKLAERVTALAERFDPALDTDATPKLEGPPGNAIPPGSGGYLKLKLTQTGAMVGTPAYMAPEQFAGTGGDARTDQFSFCVALYEGLYGRRPFAGNNAVELMANVVAGTINDPPADARVPAWIRKILLRGLSTNPEGRYPSMTELLAALGQDPAARRRRWLGAVTGTTILVAAAIGAHRFTAGQHAMCAGGPERVAVAWSPDRRSAIQRAFAATGSQNAARAFAGVASLVDQYVARWGGMYKETCEATHVRGEQSAEVLDLRMGCLGERLASVRALGDVFTSATPAVVDNAVTAAGALPTLDPCADVEMLKAVIKPPDDATVRARVAGIREEVAKVKALGDSGQCEKAATLGISATAEAKAVGYLPAEAESAFATGRLMDSCLDPAKGVALLHEAIAAAATSRHDEIFVQATLVLGPMYADRFHDIARAEENVRHGRAVLARIPGHKLLEAWADEADAILAMRQGDGEHALQFERHAYQLRAELYGQDHYELTVALTNMGMDLHSLGRDAEAESVSRRAVDMSIRLFGPESTPTAITLMNYSEIVTALGRLNEAQSAAETSLSIWRRKQAGGFVVGYCLLDVGRVQLARGEAAQAVATLQQSLKMLSDQDASVVAEAKFVLAKAFWATSPGTRAQARELVRSARDLAAKETSTKRLLSQIEAWQAAHHDI